MNDDVFARPASANVSARPASANVSARPASANVSARPASAEVERLLATAAPEMAALARRACALARSVFADAVVTVDGGDIGFGTGTGYKGLVFVVPPQRAHVTLGIAGGASLPDPAGLLQGTGKVHRHVKLRDQEDLDRPELRDLMEAAVRRTG